MVAQPEYRATVLWQKKDTESYTDNRYSRAHEWRFDEGVTVAASSSPLSVPVPLSNPAAVDPEEAFVAALSSCHMLFFLFHAAKKGYVVERYEDAAVGVMGKNAKGAMAMVRVTLRPSVRIGAATPITAGELNALHGRAHHDCYIANSVTAEVVVEPAA